MLVGFALLGIGVLTTCSDYDDVHDGGAHNLSYRSTPLYNGLASSIVRVTNERTGCATLLHLLCLTIALDDDFLRTTPVRSS